MRQILTGAYWILFALAVALIVGAMLILATPAATRWAVEQALPHTPAGLELGAIEGTLLDTIRITELRYATPALRVAAQGIVLQGTWRALLGGQLALARLEADVLTIDLPVPSATDRPSDAPILPEFTLPARLSIDSLHIGRLEIQRDEQRHLIESLHVSAAQSGAELTLNNLSLRYRDTPLEGSGHITLAAPFPLDLDVRARPRDLDLWAHIVGTPHAFDLRAEIDSRDPRWPQGHARIDGSGDLTGLAIRTLDATTLNGTVSGHGTLSWQDPLTLRLTLAGQRLDPAIWPRLAEFPGQLDVAGTLELRRDRIETTARASGRLGEYPLTASGTFKLRDEQLDVTNGVFELGPNRLTLNGEVSQRHAKNLRFELKAPDLSLLHPDLGGAVDGAGRLDGPWRQPRIALSLDGRDAGWRAMRGGKLALTVQPGVGAEHSFDLELSKLENLGPLQRLRLRGQGDPARARGSIEINLPHTRIESSLTGTLDWTRRHWSGQLAETRLTISGLPPYRQTGTASLILEPSGQHLTEWCLAGPRERGCADAAHAATGDTELRVTLSEIPLRRLGTWLPRARTLPGTLDAILKLEGDQMSWNGAAEVKLDADNRLVSNFALSRTDAALNGKLQAYFDKLDWAVLASAELDAVTGNIFADLDLGGTVDEPTLTGPVVLGSGAFRLPEWGTELDGVNLVATLATTRAIIGGQASAGDGDISLQGEADWSDLEHWRLRVDITGKDFEVVDLPTATVAVTPRLGFAASPAEIVLDGTLQVSPAKIDLGRLPASVVRPSADEIILNAVVDPDTETRQRSLPLRTHIDLVLGDQVHLVGRGLDSRLVGSLRIREDPGKPLRVFGTLRTVDGKFEAYGQALKLDKGELTFNGTLKNPAINLRAVRVTDDVTAGLRLIGTLDAPESSVFSEPTLPETDAMAYLLTGKPLSSTSQGEASLMLRAVTGLGLVGGARLIDAIRQETRLDVFELESGDDYTDSALLIGKYLSARLYVQYAIKLFEDTDIFSLRYRLSRSVQLEAESGTSQGIDLIYQFER